MPRLVVCRLVLPHPLVRAGIAGVTRLPVPPTPSNGTGCHAAVGARWTVSGGRELLRPELGFGSTVIHHDTGKS